MVTLFYGILVKVKGKIQARWEVVARVSWLNYILVRHTYSNNVLEICLTYHSIEAVMK